MNIFTSLVFALMAVGFFMYLGSPTESWIASGLYSEGGSFLGLHRMQWILIIFLNVYFIGVYAYIWGKKVGIKFLSALFYMIASIAVLYLLWPTRRGGIDGLFLSYGHIALMAGFIIGAILLTAQAYLKTLAERGQNEAGSSNVQRG